MNNIPLNAISVNTSEYERSHGKKPRGFGNWAFWIGRDTGDISKARFFTGTFPQAAKQARLMAQEQGIWSVTVGA